MNVVGFGCINGQYTKTSYNYCNYFIEKQFIEKYEQITDFSLRDKQHEQFFTKSSEHKIKYDINSF